MLVFPNAKINLGLYITGKRSDGYHNLETSFIPVPWTDGLEIIEAKEVKYSASGIPVPAVSADDNLCLKAYEALRKRYQLPPVHIHLHKHIPIGAGLGGGSSDAAFTVKLLNSKFELGLSQAEMEEIIRPLGSDCAFFIGNQPTLAHGKGDEFSPINMDHLKDWYILLLYPALHVSTKDAYSGVQPKAIEFSLADILQQPVEHWKDKLHNQFEDTVFKAHPALATIKEKLYQMGAIYSSMSGSGSCMFGLFKTMPELPNLPSNYSVLMGKL